MTTRLASILVVLAAFVATASAQVSGLLRQDRGQNGLATTVAVFDGKTGLELWGFGVDTKAPDLEIGKLFRVNSTKQQAAVLFGGYYAVWPVTGEHFAIPFAAWNTKSTIGFSGTMGYYQPLDNNFKMLFSDGMRVTTHVSGGYDAGLEAAFTAPYGSVPSYWFGPVISHANWSVRVQANAETHAIRLRTELRF